MRLIERPEYMRRLLDLMGTPDIKIVHRTPSTSAKNWGALAMKNLMDTST